MTKINPEDLAKRVETFGNDELESRAADLAKRALDADPEDFGMHNPKAGKIATFEAPLDLRRPTNNEIIALDPLINEKEAA